MITSSEHETLPAPPADAEPAPAKSRRGFASMSAEKVREIASKGGKASHALGRAHQFTSEEAREAGRKGGRANAGKSRTRRTP